MAAQPAPSRARQKPTPSRSMPRALPAEERRGWLSHGLAALAISALGLAIAGSVSLTTSAQPIAAPAPVTEAVQVEQPAGSGPVSGADQVPGVGGVVPGQTGTTSGTQPTQSPATDTVTAFTRSVLVATSSRSPQLQAAVVKERAAQRAETLAESAEQVSQAARDAGGAARSQNLVTTERATRQAAVKLAQQRLAEAVRQRVAAEGAQQAQSSTSAQTTAPSTNGDNGVDTTATVPAGGGSSSPVPGAVIGAHFGQYGSWSRYHTGLDFRAGYGTPIRAVADGIVVYAGNSNDWAGNHVAVRHAGGVTSMSSHMSSMAVSAGQSVKAGQVIGYVGQTGRAFGAHLHFELYPVGVRYGDVYKAVNPVPWLRSIGVNVN